MVSLAIVSIGLIAAFNGIIQMAHSTSVLRERALADWIAMNQITEIRLSGDFPDVGASTARGVRRTQLALGGAGFRDGRGEPAPHRHERCLRGDAA
jgi:Tfp pilus assembly protein PilV